MMDEETTREAWQEAGRQFQALGESLAQALRVAWEDEGNRQRLQDLQLGLEAMVERIGQAVAEASASAEGQRVRAEAERAADSARVASQQAWQEARPHLISALRQVNDGLQKVISRLEEE